MARDTIKFTADMTPDTKRRLMSAVGQLAGMYEVAIEPKRDTRSLRQNAWYHSCICEPFANYLNEQDYEIKSGADAHEIFKQKFLLVDILNKKTGEVIAQRTRSTTELNTAEFSEYCERCRAWLTDFFGLLTVDPDPLRLSKKE